MTLKGINITNTINQARKALDEDTELNPRFKAMVETLLIVIGLLLERLGIDSTNSSKPPSQDPNRKRGRKTKGKSGKKPGGQPGHTGATLQLVDSPDEVVVIEIDRRTIPRDEYQELLPERRQVVEIIINKHVKEYQAQVLKSKNTGEVYTALFPDQLKNPVQYGVTVKSTAVYMSQWQLLPYDRVREFFEDQASIALSPGTLFNFNQEAYEILSIFESIARAQLLISRVLHADETGINVNGKTIWLHSASNDEWSLFFPHVKRGSVATQEIGILPQYTGTLVHDCWSSYFSYNCNHAICNAHIIRELEGVIENDAHDWAKKMSNLLLEANKTCNENNGCLSDSQFKNLESSYDSILRQGQIECPLPDQLKKKTRGRIKKTKARNLLDRLIEHKNSVLRFALDPEVPFTNNRAENDIRMTKVQQKISGCFRSMDGAKIFCRIRSYLSTCRKNGVTGSDALYGLFSGKLPDFIARLIPP